MVLVEDIQNSIFHQMRNYDLFSQESEANYLSVVPAAAAAV